MISITTDTTIQDGAQHWRALLPTAAIALQPTSVQQDPGVYQLHRDFFIAQDLQTYTPWVPCCPLGDLPRRVDVRVRMGPAWQHLRPRRLRQLCSPLEFKFAHIRVDPVRDANALDVEERVGGPKTSVGSSLGIVGVLLLKIR